METRGNRFAEPLEEVTMDRWPIHTASSRGYALPPARPDSLPFIGGESDPAGRGRVRAKRERRERCRVLISYLGETGFSQ